MSDLTEHIAENVERLEAMLAKLPQPLAKEVRERIAELRRLLLQQRAPRLVLVGRRGSGKSSLINALFGAEVAAVGHEKATTGRGQWWSFEGELGKLEVLDTRGLQEGSAPEGAEAGVAPVAAVLQQIHDKAPDAALFLVKAKEADAAIGTDLELLAAICADVERRHGFKVPIVAVITHADELEPKNVRLHAPAENDPDDLAEKMERVSRIEAIVDGHFRAAPKLRDHYVRSIAVSTYQSWRRDGTRRADERWRIGELVGFLVEELPDEARVEAARVTQIHSVQAAIATRLTHVVAGLCAGIAVVPIPLADIGPITSLQVSLVAGIAFLAGRSMEMKSAAELLAAMGVNVGAGVVFREAARALIKFVFPGAGSVISGAVAYAGTVAVGAAATAYYLGGATPEQAREIFEKERAASPPPPA